MLTGHFDRVNNHDGTYQEAEEHSQLLGFDKNFYAAIELTVAGAVCAIDFIRCDRSSFSITVGGGMVGTVALLQGL